MCKVWNLWAWGMDSKADFLGASCGASIVLKVLWKTTVGRVAPSWLDRGVVISSAGISPVSFKSMRGAMIVWCK